MYTLLLFVLLVVSFFIYFIPTMIASWRNHRHLGPICAINTLLGWSILGWAAALAWSLTEEKG